MQHTVEQMAEELLIKNYEKYYRLAYLQVRSEADALDVVQESAYKVIKGCRKVKQKDYLETWICRIVLNTAMDVLRKRNTMVLVDPQEETWEGDQEEQYPDVDLQVALGKLDEKEKTTVLLRFFEDRKLDEIAQIMDVGVNTVKSRLYRALKKLKISLEE